MPESKRITTKKIFALAADYERQAEIEGRAKKEKQSISETITTEMSLRRVDSLTSDDGTKVTRVQTENVIVDPDGLYADLTPSQRRKVYREHLPLSALPAPVQRAIKDLLKQHGEKPSVIKRSLDVTALSAEVQSGKIDGDVVAEHTTITANKPYIRVSHGTGE